MISRSEPHCLFAFIHHQHNRGQPKRSSGKRAQAMHSSAADVPANVREIPKKKHHMETKSCVPGTLMHRPACSVQEPIQTPGQNRSRKFQKLQLLETSFLATNSNHLVCMSHDLLLLCPCHDWTGSQMLKHRVILDPGLCYLHVS